MSCMMSWHDLKTQDKTARGIATNTRRGVATPGRKERGRGRTEGVTALLQQAWHALSAVERLEADPTLHDNGGRHLLLLLHSVRSSENR